MRTLITQRITSFQQPEILARNAVSEFVVVRVSSQSSGILRGTHNVATKVQLKLLREQRCGNSLPKLCRRVESEQNGCKSRSILLSAATDFRALNPAVMRMWQHVVRNKNKVAKIEDKHHGLQILRYQAFWRRCGRKGFIVEYLKATDPPQLQKMPASGRGEDHRNATKVVKATSNSRIEWKWSFPSPSHLR